jgi:hypothetical protein
MYVLARVGHAYFVSDAPLPDVLRPGLRAVFCGTSAGAESARVRAYYAALV